MAVGDLNGDGKPDLAVANSNSDDVSVLLGNGDGTFQAPVSYAAGVSPVSVAVGDLNGDGKPDLAVANSGSDDVSVLLGNGDGTLPGRGRPTPPATAPVVGGGRRPQRRRQARPGRRQRRLGRRLGAARATATARFQAAVNYAAGTARRLGRGGRPQRRRQARPGRRQHRLRRRLGAARQRRRHASRPAVNYRHAAIPSRWRSATSTATASPTWPSPNGFPNDVSVLLGNGDGSFQAAVNFAAGNSPVSVALDDVNGDEKPDLSTANGNSDDASVLLNATGLGSDGSVTQTASGGDTVTTDPGNVGATADVPVQTQVALPSGQPSVTVSITAQPTTNWLPSGPIFAKQVAIAIGAAVAAASNPFVITFTLDASLLAGVAAADVQIFRDDIGLHACTDAVAAIPDACIASQAPGPGGDAVVRVRTTHFSKWNFGRLDYAFGGFLQPIDNLPTVNTMKAGSAAPVKFSLGGNKGLNIFTTRISRPRRVQLRLVGNRSSRADGDRRRVKPLLRRDEQQVHLCLEDGQDLGRDMQGTHSQAPRWHHTEGEVPAFEISRTRKVRSGI